MKKFLLAVICAAVLFVSCDSRASVKNSGIPTHYKTLQFYNGPGLIGDYKDVIMKIEIVTSTKLVGDNVSFYKYHITSVKQNINDYIIDSEALALKYTLYEEEETGE